ncbi:serine/threonine-protein kinase [Actinocorallia libanotica]
MIDSDDLVVGRYRLTALLGEGGMGEVWRARDEQLDRDVAVKRLRVPPEFGRTESAHRIARMEREARAAGVLRHRGIVTVHDQFTDAKGTPWIVMEYVPGRSLAQVIGDGGRLSPERTARIGAQIADALAAAHAAGVVHRDIKPANILLDGDRTVLTDFGIAAFEGATTLTAEGSLMGTPAYMSPEQVNGDRGTPASDLWSLGATLYHAVEGQQAFQGPNMAVTLLAVHRGVPAPMVHAGPLEPVLRSLMSKDPAHRPTAAEAAARLSAPDRSLLPTVPGAPPSAGRSPLTRRRLLIALGAAGAAVALPAAYYAFDEEAPSRKTGAPAPASTPSAPPSSWRSPARDGKPLTRSGDVSSVVFSPDGRLLAVATDTPRGDSVQLWDVAARTMQSEFANASDDRASADGQILRLAFSRDGRILAAADLEGTVRMWDMRSRTEFGMPLEHAGTVRDIAFGPDGGLLATVGKDKLVRLWDLTTYQVVRTLDPRFRHLEITAVAFSPKDDLLAVGSEEVVRLWDLGTGATRTLKAEGVIGQLAFSPDGRLLAAGGSGESGTMMVWDVASRTRLKLPFKGAAKYEYIASVAFSPDGGTLAAGSSDNVLWLWDVATGERLGKPLAHSGTVEAVAFSPTGGLLATGTGIGEGAVRLWRS